MCIDLSVAPTTSSMVPAAVRPVTPKPEPVLAAKRPVRVQKAQPHKKRPAPAPSYRTNAQVAALVLAFEDATLPREAWTHDAHLIVALAYARRLRPEVAFVRLREGIKRTNAATGTPETPTRGYHETITLAWFHLVRHFLEERDDGRPIAQLADALVERFSSKDVLFEHYSRELLLSPEARARRVDPDKKPLPSLRVFTAEDQAWVEALDARVAALAQPVTTAPVELAAAA